MNSFQGDLKQLNPRTEAQKAAFLQLLAQQDNRTDGRRERLSEANRSAISTSQPCCSRLSWTKRAPVIDSITPRTGSPWASTR